MNIKTDSIVTVTMELRMDEVRDLVNWMGRNTGPDAPQEYKQLLTKLRQIEERNKP